MFMKGINSNLLFDIFNGKILQCEIAKKYNKAESYISMLNSKINQLKYEPRIENNEIVCLKCGDNNKLVFHHNHATGEQIAIVCHHCNVKIRDNELEYNITNSNQKMVSIPDNLFQYVKDKGLSLSKFLQIKLTEEIIEDGLAPKYHINIQTKGNEK